MSDPTHECPGNGCTEQVDADKLACRRHWFQLPAAFRTAIWEAWENREAQPERHAAAIRNAVSWYARQPARTP